MTTLKEQFEFAVSEAQKPASSERRPTNEEKLEMYALYKQATIGDCNIPQPWMVNVEARAKWDAWNSKKGMSTSDAMTGYCNKFLEMKEKYD